MATRIVHDNTAAVLRQIEQQLNAVVRKAATDVEANAKAAINNGAKTGRIYRAEKTVVFNRGGAVPLHPRLIERSVTFNKGKSGHQASAPGEAPATDYGNLASSGGIVQVKPGHYQVVFSAKYARGLEMGTHKIAPRPFLRPALEKVKPSFLLAVQAVTKGNGQPNGS